MPEKNFIALETTSQEILKLISLVNLSLNISSNATKDVIKFSDGTNTIYINSGGYTGARLEF